MGQVGVLAAAAVSVWLAVLSVFDIRHGRLPNRLTLPGAAVILAAAALAGHGGSAALGAVALFAVYLMVHLVVPTAMGAGDVKLAIGVGALTGAFGSNVWVLSALAAPALTAVLALAVALRGARTVPHGPSMCVAAGGAVLVAIL